jgi:hypothetical protein
MKFRIELGDWTREATIISASPSIWMSLRRGFVRSAVGRKTGLVEFRKTDDA